MCKIDLILNEYIKKNHISRNQLSRLTGISYGQIQAYCNNDRTRVDLTVLERICDALPNCKLTDILILSRD